MYLTCQRCEGKEFQQHSISKPNHLACADCGNDLKTQADFELLDISEHGQLSPITKDGLFLYVGDPLELEDLDITQVPFDEIIDPNFAINLQTKHLAQTFPTLFNAVATPMALKYGPTLWRMTPGAELAYKSGQTLMVAKDGTNIMVFVNEAGKISNVAPMIQATGATNALVSFANVGVAISLLLIQLQLSRIEKTTVEILKTTYEIQDYLQWKDWAALNSQYSNLQKNWEIITKIGKVDEEVWNAIQSQKVTTEVSTINQIAQHALSQLVQELNTLKGLKKRQEWYSKHSKDLLTWLNSLIVSNVVLNRYDLIRSLYILDTASRPLENEILIKITTLNEISKNRDKALEQLTLDIIDSVVKAIKITEATKGKFNFVPTEAKKFKYIQKNAKSMLDCINLLSGIDTADPLLPQSDVKLIGMDPLETDKFLSKNKNAIEISQFFLNRGEILSAYAALEVDVDDGLKVSNLKNGLGFFPESGILMLTDSRIIIFRSSDLTDSGRALKEIPLGNIIDFTTSLLNGKTDESKIRINWTLAGEKKSRKYHFKHSRHRSDDLKIAINSAIKNLSM